MDIMKSFLFSKSFRIFLVVCFCQLILEEPLLSAERQVSTLNIRVTHSTSKVKILYDLVGEAEKYSRVELVMLKKSDPQFRYLPQRVTGDIGNSITIGTNHTLEWDAKEEFPAGLAYDDIYFSLNTAEDTGTSISPWIWIAGVAVVGIIIYFLVKKPKTESSGDFLSLLVDPKLKKLYFFFIFS